MLKLSEKHDSILSATGHVLVTGGPGAGKTTVSILKAATVVQNHLKSGQRVLFLSFARATVSRVVEAIGHEHQIVPDVKKRILVETYHAFFWRILKSHGYLIGLPRRLSILLPTNEAIALAGIRRQYGTEKNLDADTRTEKEREEKRELYRLAVEEGQVCFDLFAYFVNKLLYGSTRLCKLISMAFPYVILDEFQDTNQHQWEAMKALCGNSTMLALADPEQRIYDWLGADPERLNHFRAQCNPLEVDLGKDNHRNQDTEIRMFGDDVLNGRYSKNTYNGVNLFTYQCNQNQALTSIITHVLKARKRLIDSKIQGWSLAVLTPTKRLTRQVSDIFRSPLSMFPRIRHTAAIDAEGAILGAELLGHLLQPHIGNSHMPRFIEMLCGFYRGKGGDNPSNAALQEASQIQKAFDDFIARSDEGKMIRNNSLLVATFSVYQQTQELALTGNPDTDWMEMRRILSNGPCKRLKDVAEELKNIRLLNRGTQLRQALSQCWRDNGSYIGAPEKIRQTFVQEHFSMSQRPETGIVVMNMHKAKGKQFDEVIIFEGWPRFQGRKMVSNSDRIVRGNAAKNIDIHARQNFRVSITRAKQRTTILTPECNPCILLQKKTKTP